jgi:hypothetical protein
MISRSKRVDGVVIWDMICGTLGRPCPKLRAPDGEVRRTSLGPFLTPPPCLYVFPAEIPSLASPQSTAQALNEVELLAAFQKAFGGRDEEVNYVDFEVSKQGDELFRRTVIRRGGIVQHASEMTAIQRV